MKQVQEPTGVGRIALAAFICAGQPNVVFTKFRDTLAPHIRIEIVREVLKEIHMSGTFQRAMELRDELAELERIVNENPL